MELLQQNEQKWQRGGLTIGLRLRASVLALLLGAAGLAPLPAIVGGTTLEARTSIQSASGRWVSYSWDGEGAPERIELRLEIDTAADRFSALVVRPGQSPLHLSGVLGEQGRLSSSDGTVLELRPDAALELRRPASNSLAFWQE